MRDVYITATGCTTFGDHSASTPAALAGEVLVRMAQDLGAGDLTMVESAWFGSCFLDAWGQPNIRGHAVLAPSSEAGVLEQGLPITNVEAACATGSVALLGAVNEIRAGVRDVTAAVGVEKMRFGGGNRPAASIFDSLAGCAERLDDGRLLALYEGASESAGRPWDPPAGGSLFMETYAVQAHLHMRRHGVTQRHIAIAAAKAHRYAAANPLAQYGFEVSVEDVLRDRPVTHPFTRAMCAPIGDGAAGVVLASPEWLADQPENVRSRAVRIAGIGTSSGRYGRTAAEPTLTRAAASEAFAQAELSAADIDVVEVHDATSYGEILQLEMLGLCEEGAAASMIESGETGPGGVLPVNTSGGLVAKGHPVAATGLSMVHELVGQLRGEAGPRQVEGARTGLAENGGGVLGLEEAACVVTILEGAA